MPRKSVKEQVIDYLIEDAAGRILWVDELDSSENDEEVDEILDDLNDDLLTVLTCRRGSTAPSNIPKDVIEERENFLINMNDEQFQDMFRINRTQFIYLVTSIRDDIEFNKANSCKQISIELQLAVVLYRLGIYGKNAAVRNVSTLFGIGDGGTLAKITQRIFRVILKLKTKYLHWPNIEERSEIIAATYTELPLCIGYIDTIEIKHANFINSETQISSIKAQIICDYKQRIRHVVVGCSGNCNNDEIFNNSLLYKNKNEFFSNNEWIAGDNTYQLSDILITPYRNNSKQLTDTRRQSFNLRHHKFKSRIDQCLNLLTEKFASLKELRTRFENKESHKNCCEWIIVCCILYNIFLQDDEVVEISDKRLRQKFEADYNNTHDVNNIVVNQEYELKRHEIFHLMFENENIY